VLIPHCGSNVEARFQRPRQTAYIYEIDSENNFFEEEGLVSKGYQFAQTTPLKLVEKLNV
jgi:hypothetical protein